ncbi:MAG: ATP-binding protein [Actinomadura sp.]
MPATRELGRAEVLAWPMSHGSRCAGVARTLVGDVLAAIGTPPEVIHDARLMISELATNAFEHARCPAGEDRGAAELWMHRLGRRIVCGVFDPVPELPLPRRSLTTAAAAGLREHGRGLGIVHAYSLGCWGAHRTRGRLGRRLPGKVVWFVCPTEIGTLPAGGGPGARGAAAVNPERR